MANAFDDRAYEIPDDIRFEAEALIKKRMSDRRKVKYILAELRDKGRTEDEERFAAGWASLVALSMAVSDRAGWWYENDGVTPRARNMGEMIALAHSELSEALEGHRKNLMDDKLEHRRMIEVEFGDLIIRIADVAGKLGFDVAGAAIEKNRFNDMREDHKREARALGGAGTKAY